MRITKVNLNRYLGFYYSRAFELKSSVSFIVGKNNSGKTALIRALSSNPNEKCSADIEHTSVHSLESAVQDANQQPELTIMKYVTNFKIEHS